MKLVVGERRRCCATAAPNFRGGDDESTRMAASAAPGCRGDRHLPAVSRARGGGQ